MRCPRCGFDNTGEPTACAQCGVVLATASTGQVGSAARTTGEIPKPAAAAPVWQRPKEAKPAEAPPWSGAENAAPWQTPPEFGVPKRARPGRDADKADKSDRKTKPDKKVRDDFLVGGADKAPPVRRKADENGPPKPGRGLPDAETVVIAGVVGVNALFSVVYSLYILFDRRGVFASLAADASSITKEAAESSDTLNSTLFVLAGVLTLAAGAALGFWLSRLRRQGTSPQEVLPVGWFGITAVGVLAVLIALVMHIGKNPSQIATGYVIMGIGGLLLAGAMAWAALIVFRDERPKPAFYPHPLSTP